MLDRIDFKVQQLRLAKRYRQAAYREKSDNKSVNLRHENNNLKYTGHSGL